MFFSIAADALLVGREELQIACLSRPGSALGEGGVDFGVGGIWIGVLLVAESEDRVFEGSGAVEAPLVFRNGLGEVELKCADGGEGLADGVAVWLEAAWSSGVWMTIWPVPETAMIFGRNPRPASHYVFRADPPLRTKQYLDPLDKPLKGFVQLRSLKANGAPGLQTVVPPSVHPEGQEVRFESGCDASPANIDADKLEQAVARVSAAALLARHWPGEKAGAIRLFSHWRVPPPEPDGVPIRPKPSFERSSARCEGPKPTSPRPAPK